MIPFRLLFAALVSAAIHELGHMTAFRLLRLEIYSIDIGIHGAKIHGQPLSEKQEILCAAAGPLCGLLLVPFFRWIPAVSLCAAVHTFYNLLPVFPADGGRILRSGAKLLLKEKLADSVSTAIEIISLSAILALCVYGTIFLRLGIIPILFALSLIVVSARQNG